MTEMGKDIIQVRPSKFRWPKERFAQLRGAIARVISATFA